MADVTILNRARSILSGPTFGLRESPVPFDFDLVPQGVIDGSFRVETNTTRVVAGLAFSEERFDTMTVWLAKAHGGDQHATRQALMVLCNSVTAAVIRDGAGVGDFAVPDEGRGSDVAAVPESTYNVGRLTLPVSYMVEV